MEEIDHSRPWGCFYGSSQDQQLSCGGGGCLYLSKSHSFHLSSGLGRGSNNFAELMALKILILFALEQHCHSLQSFGDSMIVLDWARGSSRCNVFRILPILEEVVLLLQNFNDISFTHVYREKNGVVDLLSKEATQLSFGCWNIIEQDLDGIYCYFHRPFIEDQALDILDRDCQHYLGISIF